MSLFSTGLLGYHCVMKKPDPNNYPTWKVHARPIGAAHESWQTMNIQARSALQAQAILRRRGYEMVVESAMTISAKPQTIAPLRLEPLKCDRCNYALEGLIIESASVICPECSYPQPLIAWNPEYAAGLKGTHPVIRILAGLGMIFLALFILLVSLILLGN